jgi:hypothetical protein
MQAGSCAAADASSDSANAKASDIRGIFISLADLLGELCSLASSIRQLVAADAAGFVVQKIGKCAIARLVDREGWFRLLNGSSTTAARIPVLGLSAL